MPHQEGTAAILATLRAERRGQSGAGADFSPSTVLLSSAVQNFPPTRYSYYIRLSPTHYILSN